jgi:putative membrane protein
MAAGAPVAANAPLTTELYIAEAGRSDLYEIESSRLAQQRGVSPMVKSMADMLIRDHTNATTMVMGAAKAANIQAPPPTLDPRRSAMITQLRGLSGAEFDRAYLAQQTLAHQEALALHQAYAANGQVSQLRDAARHISGVVEHHLHTAQGHRAAGG